MNRYTVRLCFRNADTHVLLVTQDFPEKKFRSVKAGTKFLEDRVKGMKCISMQPRIDIFGQVMNGKEVEYGIALF